MVRHPRVKRSKGTPSSTPRTMYSACVATRTSMSSWHASIKSDRRKVAVYKRAENRCLAIRRYTRTRTLLFASRSHGPLQRLLRVYTALYSTQQRSVYIQRYKVPLSTAIYSAIYTRYNLYTPLPLVIILSGIGLYIPKVQRRLHPLGRVLYLYMA